MRYSRAFLRHLFKAKEILGPVLATQHNLFFLRRLVDDIREAIRADRFTEFAREFLSEYEQNA
jgi:queuine tRNA-ribosyltransferase